MKKQITSLLLALVLCLCSVTTAFAADFTTASEDVTIPEDAKILFQDENVVLYQSKTETAENRLENETYSTLRTDDNYGYAWVNPGDGGSYFTVNNTITGRMGVTWKVESDSSSDHAQIWMETSGGLTVLTTRDVYPGDGDVRLVIQNGIKTKYKVRYIPVRNTSGMRIMCWTYNG